MDNKLEKDIRLLKVWAVVTTLGLVVYVVSAFTAPPRKQKFDEIDVGRINVVEKDGSLKIVISNEERQTPVIVDGQMLGREGQRPPGIIFFNDRGDEMGGLVISGNTGEGQYGSLTFDKFRGDQTIAFQHLESRTGDYFAGLTFNDVKTPTVELAQKMDAIKKLPDEAARKAAEKEMTDKGEFMVARMSIGKGRDKAAFISLNDAKGKPRIKISVTADGTARIDFLDAAGKVMQSLPTRD